MLILIFNSQVIIQAQFAGNFGSYPYPCYGPPQPYPIIIKSDDNDNGWGRILPILLLLLCDNWGGWGGGHGGNGGGRGNGCCGGCCCGCCGGGSNTIPIPYPIPIPINNPIIT